MRIILADDDPLSRRTLSDLLSKWGYEVVAAGEGPEAWLVLQKQSEPCIALLSGRLPQLDGFEICRRVRSRSTGPKMHLVLLGTQVTRDEVLKAVETVADDYVFKPCNPQELRTRLRLGRRMLELEAAAEKQAARDSLTGTLTRESIIGELSQELDRSRRQKQPVTIMIVGIDRLDRIFELHGQSAKNAVVVEVARKLSEGLRPYDSVGRLDEDGFVVILPGADTAIGERQAGRICQTVAAQAMQVSQHPVFVTCSAGVAGSAGTENDADALIRRGIAALAKAKSAGGNSTATA